MIVMLLTTQNEADVLRLNLAHHLAWGADHIGVCDNESSDHTVEVVRSFGSVVTHNRFRDFAERQRHRMDTLERIKQRVGPVDWVGVSDTDEFLWAPDVRLPDLFVDVPDDVVAVTFHQRLFLPTAADAPDGPVYRRQTHRTGSYDSALHTSYREGKTFYRGSWLTRITSEHRGHDVPHEVWSPPDPFAVHHYMIRDEDQFVMKVKRLSSWRERKGLKSKLWYQSLRKGIGMPLPPFVAGFKATWWNVYREGGESGLRAYYRDTYRVQTADLPGLIASGDLVHDTAFAAWTTAQGLGS